MESDWWMVMWVGIWLVDGVVRWNLIGGWCYEVIVLLLWRWCRGEGMWMLWAACRLLRENPMLRIDNSTPAPVISDTMVQSETKWFMLNHIMTRSGVVQSSLPIDGRPGKKCRCQLARDGCGWQQSHRWQRSMWKLTQKEGKEKLKIEKCAVFVKM